MKSPEERKASMTAAPEAWRKLQETDAEKVRMLEAEAAKRNQQLQQQLSSPATQYTLAQRKGLRSRVTKKVKRLVCELCRLHIFQMIFYIKLCTHRTQHVL